MGKMKEERERDDLPKSEAGGDQLPKSRFPQCPSHNSLGCSLNSILSQIDCCCERVQNFAKKMFEGNILGRMTAPLG